ncbi:MAG: hypothetical protein ACOYB4_03180, partial [Methyloceanibacter sp.]
NNRHVHTRQQAENVGVVLSYSGMDGNGTFDIERLRYNDFYGAVGWKGSKQDLTVSGLFFRQRDDYDERNLFLDEFLRHPRCKKDPCMTGDFPNRTGNQFNTYNANLVMGQVAHNYYFDADTTLSTRFYGYHHERARFESRRGGPRPTLQGQTVNNGNNMRGRDRLYEHYGVDSRLEFANRPFIGAMTQDIQVGARVEYHEFNNCNSSGRTREILNWENQGNCYAQRNQPPGPGGFREDGRVELYETTPFSGFLQSAVHVTEALTVVPGVRFEYYDLSRDTLWAVTTPPFVGPVKESVDHSEVLPGLSFSWGFGRINNPAEDWRYNGKLYQTPQTAPQFNTTFYGGYQRGMGIPVARGEVLSELNPEIGDNFQLGIRTTAIKGFTFDGALYHNRISDYQIKSAFTDPLGNNVFNSVDQVEIEGAELYARLDTQPFTGGSFNFFGESTFTYAHSEITKDRQDPTVVGNLVPEVPREFVNLTAGIEHRSGFNASVTWTYRGSFFTDLDNNVGLVDEDGDPMTPFVNANAMPVGGQVDSVWLLSARANYSIPNTPLTLFVSGSNLTDELYINDLTDGIIPGMGRTIWGGFTVKWGGERRALVDNTDGYGGYR